MKKAEKSAVKILSALLTLAMLLNCFGILPAVISSAAEWEHIVKTDVVYTPVTVYELLGTNELTAGKTYLIGVRYTNNVMNTNLGQTSITRTAAGSTAYYTKNDGSDVIYTAANPFVESDSLSACEFEYDSNLHLRNPASGLYLSIQSTSDRDLEMMSSPVNEWVIVSSRLSYVTSSRTYNMRYYWNNYSLDTSTNSTYTALYLYEKKTVYQKTSDTVDHGYFSYNGQTEFVYDYNESFSETDVLNAVSVLYKATQNGAESTLDINDPRISLVWNDEVDTSVPGEYTAGVYAEGTLLSTISVTVNESDIHSVQGNYWTRVESLDDIESGGLYVILPAGEDTVLALNDAETFSALNVVVSEEDEYGYHVITCNGKELPAAACWTINGDNQNFTVENLEYLSYLYPSEQGIVDPDKQTAVISQITGSELFNISGSGKYLDYANSEFTAADGNDLSGVRIYRLSEMIKGDSTLCVSVSSTSESEEWEDTEYQFKIFSSRTSDFQKNKVVVNTPYKVYDEAGNFVRTEEVGSDGLFSLNNGEKAVFSQMRSGMYYAVEEVRTDDEYWEEIERVFAKVSDAYSEMTDTRTSYYYLLNDNVKEFDFVNYTMHSNGGLKYNKTATRTGDKTYKLTLESYATGYTTTVIDTKPADILLVLDRSGSMVQNQYALESYSPIKGETYYDHRLTYSTMPTEGGRTVNSNPITWCDTCNGWTFTNHSHGSNAVITPKTGPDDNNSSHTQFYETHMQATIRSLNSFIGNLIDSGVDYRIAVTSFAGSTNNVGVAGSGDEFKIYDGSTIYNEDSNESSIPYNNLYKSLTTEEGRQAVNDALYAYSDMAYSYAATYAHRGMEVATKIIDENPVDPEEREQVVILFTDGAPGVGKTYDRNYADSAISYSKTLKDMGIPVYSVGLFTGSDITDVADSSYENRSNRFLNLVSSNYENATSMSSSGSRTSDQYYIASDDVSSLMDAFDIISHELSSTTVLLDDETIVRDIISDYYELDEVIEDVMVYTVPYDYDTHSFDESKKAIYTGATVTLDGKTIDVTGFDFAAHFVDSEASSGDGMKLIVEIPVEYNGEWPEEEYDVAMPTNDPGSGIYPDEKTPPIISFPVPKVLAININPDTVVIDYGIPVKIHVKVNDNIYEDAGSISGISEAVTAGTVLNNGMYTASMADGETAASGETLALAHGTAYIENDYIVYLPTDMLMDAEEVFYYEYTAEDGNLLYSTVTVIPAANIYYEDSFITFIDNGDYEWLTAGTEYENVFQAEDRPGGDIISEYDANNAYGRDAAYDNRTTTYSLGSSRYTEVDSASTGKEPTAEFSFCGTGFDFFSTTENDTGTVLVDVMKDGKAVQKKVVNTYYGYTHGRAYLDENGEVTSDDSGEPLYLAPEITADAYMVDGKICSTTPYYYESDGKTLTKTDTGNPAYASGWVVTDSGEGLYQVPVIRIRNLEYGKYDVVITPRYSKMFDMRYRKGLDSDSYKIYVDGVRIYDPAGIEPAADSVVGDAYIRDSEYIPQYIEIRNQIISADTFYNSTKELSADDLTAGVVFIDGVTELTSDKIGDLSELEISDSYVKSGPNNEIYLAKGQAIAFYLLSDRSIEPDSLQLGMKTVAGGTSVLMCTNAGMDTGISVNVAGGSEQYRKISDLVVWDENALEDGTYRTKYPIIIANTSDTVASLTTLKWTYSATEDNGGNMPLFAMAVSPDITALTANALMRAFGMELEKTEVSTDDVSVSWISGSIEEGGTAVLQVVTPADITAVTVGGVILDDYATDEAGNKVWTYSLTLTRSGEYEYNIILKDNDGNVSEILPTGAINVESVPEAEEPEDTGSEEQTSGALAFIRRLVDRIKEILINIMGWWK